MPVVPKMHLSLPLSLCPHLLLLSSASTLAPRSWTNCRHYCPQAFALTFSCQVFKGPLLFIRKNLLFSCHLLKRWYLFLILSYPVWGSNRINMDPFTLLAFWSLTTFWRYLIYLAGRVCFRKQGCYHKEEHPNHCKLHSPNQFHSSIPEQSLIGW